MTVDEIVLKYKVQICERQKAVKNDYKMELDRLKVKHVQGKINSVFNMSMSCRHRICRAGSYVYNCPRCFCFLI